ncbi:DoxX family protein [Pontibacter anaerobius]|uniref:DoxX family protein n=1 Tax=Pontibacter anaerobius TaxID=2993940 RepID=A0ABT3RAK3_9BACT|nr:DoxX family protein [Pontibacter anaerobius]MCX2738459.1 DoxX family protein [Pontibacter anaerobius]
MLQKIIRTDNAKTTILIRLIVGVVFLSEGIQKFLFPDTRGAGRFEKIGLPSPEFLGYFVGSFETICGALILLGLLTRLPHRLGHVAGQYFPAAKRRRLLVGR